MRHSLSLSLVFVLTCLGCQGDGWLSRKEPPPAMDPELSPAEAEAIKRFANSSAVRGTIGELTWVRGLRRMRVKGYGLVVGLGQNGSRTCGERVRKRLSAEIRKKYRFGDSRIGLGNMSPEKLISSPDTAVVLVQGEISAAALKGSRFDLSVQALPGTETTSLAGGSLYTCDLRLFADRGNGTIQEGKVIARGEGQVFVNPFGQSENAATPTNARIGKILGGGISTEDRRIKLVLSTPSYPRAIRIQDRINDRFGGEQRVATAESPAYVSLKIPETYFGREKHFLGLVAHLYMTKNAAVIEEMTLKLLNELEDPQAPHDSISLALEGIGKTIRPMLRGLYADAKQHVSYYAARTGIRLGDSLAANVLREHAGSAASPYQIDSIRELSRATAVLRARSALREIVKQDLDPRIRVLAYEGLVQHNDPTLNSIDLAGQFKLDHIEHTDGPPMVYAKVDQQCRMVVIGSPECRTPLFYRHPKGVLTVNANDDDNQLTLIRATQSGRVSPTYYGPLDVHAFIEIMGTRAGVSMGAKTQGLGLSYAEIIEILWSLSDSSTIAAEFRLERPGELEVLTMPKDTGRPESEL